MDEFFYKLAYIVRELTGKSLLPTAHDVRMIALIDSCNEYLQRNSIRTTVRILWPTFFNLNRTWWAHDGIWAAALRLRGADIVTTTCARLQSDQCMLWSGKWQKTGEPGFREHRDRLCQTCMENDVEMWKRFGIAPLHLPSYMTTGEIAAARAEVKEWMKSDWTKVQWCGFDIGYEAWKAVVNNDLQGEIHDWWRVRADEMAFHHLSNIRLLLCSYERLFDQLRPDRVFGEGPFYYHMATVAHVAAQRGVPYFGNYNTGLHPPMDWTYHRNGRALFDVGLAWESWLKEPWTVQQEKRVDVDLEKRGLMVDCRSNQEETKLRLGRDLGFDPSKPMAVAPTGVIWDAHTNVRSEAFDNMYDWLFETMEWFKKRPEYQLVIRVHPGELVAPWVAPSTRTTFEREMRRRGVEPAPNVIVVPRDDKVSTYELAAAASVGIVYTSTTGLEMAICGLPVVPVGPAHYCGKGFTFDPRSASEYSEILDKILSGNVSDDEENRVRRAKRYWFLGAYHHSVVTGLLENDKEVQTPKKVLTYKDLLPGANPYIDYICDSVIQDLPIMGENRWPPEGPKRLHAGKHW